MYGRTILDIIVIETAGVQFADVERYLHCVSKPRQDAVLRKRNDEQKVQSLVAGLLVRSELSRRVGIPFEKVAFEKGPHGKPYLKGGAVQFSLSHTKGAVCAAFADGTEDIGVDIERRDRRVSENMRSRVLSENERSIAVSGEDIIRIWVKKEAFLKRTGIGIATDLRGADTTLLPDVTCFEAGAYFVGVAGKGAAEANITVMELSELLKRF